MIDYLLFKKMIAPFVIPILFWIGVIACIIIGSTYIIVGTTEPKPDGYWMMLFGFGNIILGSIIWRLCCELMLILFRIYDQLTNIKNTLNSQPENQLNTQNVE